MTRGSSGLSPRARCTLPRVRLTFHRRLARPGLASLARLGIVASHFPRAFRKVRARQSDAHGAARKKSASATRDGRLATASRLPVFPRFSPNRHTEGLRGDLPATSLWESRSRDGCLPILMFPASMLTLRRLDAGNKMGPDAV